MTASADWPIVELGAGLSVRHGFAFKGEFFRDSGDLIVLTPGNFHEGGGFKLKSREKYYDGPVPDGYLLHRGDVVVAMTEQSKGLLGSTATVPADDTFLHNQRLGLLQVTDSGLLDLRFCYHVLNTPEARNQIQATATGSKVRHTAPERIQAIRMPIPGVDYQRKVAGALDSVEGLIGNNRRRIQILEEMARLIYREWFVHFRFPGHEDVELVVDSDLGRIPEGWRVTSLAEHVELKRRNVKPVDWPDEPFDHYSIPAFDADRLPAVEAGSEIKSGKYELNADCVLLSKLNPRFARVWRAGPQRSERRSICSTEFLVLEATGDWPNPFVFSLVSDGDFGARLASMAGGTSTSHQRAMPKDVMALPVSGPPGDLVASYLDQVGPMLELADNLVLQNDMLSEARDLLLPRLISDELNVSDLDLDLDSVA
jgi:type I restriction enzyme S subunit